MRRGRSMRGGTRCGRFGSRLRSSLGSCGMSFSQSIQSRTLDGIVR
jgi:hypothetical protein